MENERINMKQRNVIHRYFQTLLFPPHHCLLCEKPIDRSNGIRHHFRWSGVSQERRILRRFSQMTDVCHSCKEKIEIPHGHYCHYCHKPMNKGTDDSESFICEDCQSYHIPNVLNRSAVLYNSFIKEKVALYKYRGKESLSEIFSRWLFITYEAYFLHENIDFISFVPLHPLRLRERGFNQSEQLANQLSKYTGIPVLDLLERVKHTEKQSKRTKKERLKQIKGNFNLNPFFLPTIKAKHILLVDDIYTTGATIHECADRLLTAGAKKVYSLTLARAYDEKNNDKNTFFL